MRGIRQFDDGESTHGAGTGRFPPTERDPAGNDAESYSRVQLIPAVCRVKAFERQRRVLL